MGLEREYGYEWRDQLKDTKYPFCDRCTLATADNLVIDKAAIYDASFYIVNWGSRLFITSIEVLSDVDTQANIYVGSSINKRVAQATIDPFDVPEVITFFDTLGRPAGIMVVDTIAMSFLQTWPIGEHMFRDTAEFVPSVVLPMPDNIVSSLKCEDDALVNKRGIVNDIPVIPASEPRVTASNAGRPVNVSVRNVFRCGASVRPVFVDVESSAPETLRRASVSPSAARILASRYCPDVIGAMRSRTFVMLTVGRAASTAVASTSGATTSGVFSTIASLSVGWISSTASGFSSAATSIT